jgi:ADP-L-glycero-D-manno-heptose 6-epimerase
MILITGGAGFIGSNIAAVFHERNHDIAICDWLGQNDKWKNIQKLVPQDIITPEALPHWLERRGNEIDAVIHMGAISATTETDADLIIENNFRLSVSLWHYCATFNIPLIYASSAATYGDGVADYVQSYLHSENQYR